MRYAPGAGSHTIGDLNPSLTYEVQVWAENRGGAGRRAGASGSPLLATAVPLSALTVVDDSGAALPLRLVLVRTTGGQSVTGDAYEQDPAAHDAAFYAFVASAARRRRVCGDGCRPRPAAHAEPSTACPPERVARARC